MVLVVEGIVFSQNKTTIKSQATRNGYEYSKNLDSLSDNMEILFIQLTFTRLQTNTPEQDRAQQQTLNSSYVNVRIVRENVADSDYWHEVQRRAGTLKISSEPKTMAVTFLESASAEVGILNVCILLPCND